ncbi:cytochrome b/b6 domain-containing protein [Xinfangfangia pollutisoli]|uniref:cytochrome b/b6 domain-containing protein n=1 Tax=Xinfangfangia pollutisoli TaxID=2865960 RepID=UPI001CD3F283|nr:cytochrome b/b6 domain-containing protein [Xinfangfangia pollutisoli]
MTVLPLRKDEPAPDAGTPPTLWDPVVRLTHWSVAMIVLLNGLWTKGGGALHVALGWVAMSILALRLIWGLIGPREARFSAFPPHPVAALRHLGQLARGRPGLHGSHNPAGAMMAYVLWACLAVLIGTGLVLSGGRTPMQVAADQAAVAAGDWSVLVASSDGQGDDQDGATLRHLAEEVHEVTSSLILFLAALHVAGVAVESLALRRNLLAPMVLGRRGRRRG